MLKKTLQLTIGLFILGSSSFAQWGGSNTTTGDTYRDGNVGIGTGAPSQRLDVRGNIYTTGSMIVDGGDLLLARTTNDYGFIIRPDIVGKKNLAFAVAGGGPLDLLYLNSNTSYFTGNVGMGTANPVQKLDVRGNIYTTGSMIVDGGDLFLARTTNDYGFIVRPNVPNKKNLAFAVEGGGSLDLLHVNSNLSYFAGSIGIGTTNFNTSDYKLAVDGKIGARAVKVTLQNPFPDYVFDSTYELRPLANLSKYIDQNKHLPGIPSAAEVEKEGGVELGEMNVKLLEKVEELTLYILELNKKLEQQQKEIDLLKQSGKK